MCRIFKAKCVHLDALIGVNDGSCIRYNLRHTAHNEIYR